MSLACEQDLVNQAQNPMYQTQRLKHTHQVTMIIVIVSLAQGVSQHSQWDNNYYPIPNLPSFLPPLKYSEDFFIYLNILQVYNIVINPRRACAGGLL